MEVINLYQDVANKMVIELNGVRNYNNKEVRRVRVDLLQVILKTKAIICLSYLDDNNDVVISQPLILEFDTYGAWGADDDYIINYIKNNA
jgi:hypothetical protein